MELPRRLLVRLERRIEDSIEGLRGAWDKITPKIFGDELATAIVDELERESAALGHHTVSGLARRLATTFRGCFEDLRTPESRPAVDREIAGSGSEIVGYVFTGIPDPSDVADVVAKWANITWTGVAEVEAPLAVPSFEAWFTGGGWRTILADPGDATGARKRVLVAPSVYAPLLASCLGPPPRTIEGLALLAQLGDPDASEELALHFGNAATVDRAVDVLEQATRLKLRAPVIAERIVRELPRLSSSVRSTWRLAALCIRRSAAVAPEVIDAAAAAIEPGAELFDVAAALALLDAAAKIAPQLGARAAEVVLREAIHEPAWRQVAGAALRLLAKAGGCADELDILRSLAARDPKLAELVAIRLEMLTARSS